MEEGKAMVEESKVGVGAKVGGVCCPCCLHAKYRFCRPCKCTIVGCLGCCCWTVLILVAIYFFALFVIVKGIICEKLAGQMFPDQGWLDYAKTKTPEEWVFSGSQESCKSWINDFNVSDWQVDAGSYEEVFFKSTDGLEIHGYWFGGRKGTTMGDPSQAPTIIQVHGHGPYVAMQSEMLPAKAMSEQGFNVFAFNNRGLGKSEAPSGSAVRSFGVDEMADSEGAIKYVTEVKGMPLSKIGIYTSSGANGMLWFFRKQIPGVVMNAAIYDWMVRFERDVGNLGKIPLLPVVMDQCVADQTSSGKGVSNFNYHAQLQKEVYDPNGRRVFLMHNKGDRYNLFENNAEKWEPDLKAKGFTVETFYPNDVAMTGGMPTEMHASELPQEALGDNRQSAKMESFSLSPEPQKVGNEHNGDVFKIERAKSQRGNCSLEPLRATSKSERIAPGMQEWGASQLALSHEQSAAEAVNSSNIVEPRQAGNEMAAGQNAQTSRDDNFKSTSERESLRILSDDTEALVSAGPQALKDFLQQASQEIEAGLVELTARVQRHFAKTSADLDYILTQQSDETLQTEGVLHHSDLISKTGQNLVMGPTLLKLSMIFEDKLSSLGEELDKLAKGSLGSSVYKKRKTAKSRKSLTKEQGVEGN